METPSLPPTPVAPVGSPRSGWKKPVLIICGAVIACCALTAVGTAWWVKRNLYASALKPVSLSASEQAVFEQKVAELEFASEIASGTPNAEAPIDQEVANRTLTVTAKEMNAFLAKQGLGEQVKIDLSRHRLTAHFLLPIDESAPLLGGVTLRLRLALSALLNKAGKLELKIADVSVGGVPIPNAWLGDIKGLDLITSELGHDPALQRLVAGIKEFEIQEGSLRVLLNE